MQELHFISQDGPKDSWTLMSHCVDCQLPMAIKYKSYRLRKSQSRCHACRAVKSAELKSSKMKELWKNDIYKSNVCKGLINVNKSEKNSRISQSMKSYFSNSVNKESHFINLPKVMQGKKKKISRAMKEKWKDESYRNKVVESQKKNADELWGFKMDLRRKLNKLN